jgi:hypothetical protein
VFQLCQLAWHADVVEENGLFACSTGDDASGEEEKKVRMMIVQLEELARAPPLLLWPGPE